MDAEYYFANGTQLAKGEGFTEPFVWNYLDDPQNVIHPSNTYWMPFTSVISAAGMLVMGNQSFFAGRIPFVFLSALIPIVTSYIAWIFSNRRSAAWLAGLLTIFGGFFTLYYSITDTFVPYMLFGGISFIIINNLFIQNKIGIRWEFIFLGCIAGLFHASRSDGLIWLIGFLTVAIWEGNHTKRKVGLILLSIVFLISGYLLIMGAWYVRNITIFHSLMSPGTSKVLWLTEYDEIFSYPTSTISFNKWWEMGLSYHLISYFRAFGANLSTLFGVEGMVFLTPMILLGVVKFWENNAVKFFSCMWIVTFVILSIIFPFAGMRGGFLHSSAAFQTIFFALVPVGLYQVINFGIKKRNWKENRSIRMFYPAVILFAVIFTLFIYWDRVIDIKYMKSGWDENAASFALIEEHLLSVGAEPDDIVMITNPPGYYAQTGRSGIVTPFGNNENLLLAAKAFGANYLILTSDHVAGLDDLYKSNTSTEELLLVDNSIEEVQIYEIATK